VEKFTGTQFIVIFRKFFQSITTATFINNDTADRKMSLLSGSKMLLYPYISKQKDFGYSDATKNNESLRQLDKLFSDSSEKIRLVNSVIHHYNLNPVEILSN
jgi:glycosyl transferase family 25